MLKVSFTPSSRTVALGRRSGVKVVNDALSPPFSIARPRGGVDRIEVDTIDCKSNCLAWEDAPALESTDNFGERGGFVRGELGAEP